MSPLAYHTLWLAIALLAIAIASAFITRRVRSLEWRRLKAEEMLEALARYAEWVAGQRRAPVFAGDWRGAGSPLDKVRAMATAWFPERSADVWELLALHRQLVDFLAAQQQLRLRDPELWLESDHDRRFMALWREHRVAVHRMADRLRQDARPEIDAEPESIFPA